MEMDTYERWQSDLADPKKRDAACKEIAEMCRRALLAIDNPEAFFAWRLILTARREKPDIAEPELKAFVAEVFKTVGAKLTKPVFEAALIMTANAAE
jgi:hypothetical protein